MSNTDALAWQASLFSTFHTEILHYCCKEGSPSCSVCSHWTKQCWLKAAPVCHFIRNVKRHHNVEILSVLLNIFPWFSPCNSKHATADCLQSYGCCCSVVIKIHHASWHVTLFEDTVWLSLRRKDALFWGKVHWSLDQEGSLSWWFFSLQVAREGKFSDLNHVK